MNETKKIVIKREFHFIYIDYQLIKIYIKKTYCLFKKKYTHQNTPWPPQHNKLETTNHNKHIWKQQNQHEPTQTHKNTHIHATRYYKLWSR